MNEGYAKWYQEFKDFVAEFEDDALFSSLDSLLQSSQNTFAFNKKLMEKAIDVSWVEAIENGLPHLDTVLRNPRKTIEDVEEIVPIALSRKITVESVKHLAQHTDLIQSIDEKSGKITPSKILNIYKEESLLTYENKFVNTLVDRLYLFINRRYEKLAQVAKDEEVFTLGYNTSVDAGNGSKMKLTLKLETVDSLDSYDANGMTIWQRVEKLKTAIEGYKGSELCQTLGQTFIRPPVMRTNAIMKNVDLKACLTLWQYIVGYDKVGYEINVQDTAVKPQEDYVQDFYKMVVMNLLLFRSHMNGGKELEVLKTRKRTRPIAPKFLKHFEKELAADYNVQTEGVAGYLASDGDLKIVKQLPVEANQIYEEINQAIIIEKNFFAEQEARRRAQLLAEEEAERRRQEEEAHRLELQRIEEARQAELERIRREQEEEERRVQEMLEQKRLEQEAAERERARLEEIRLAKLEEERKRREEEERAAAERARLAEEKQLVRENLGDAEGLDSNALKQDPTEEELEAKAYEELTEEEIEQVREEQEDLGIDAEFEDPRVIAARKKVEQEREAKERRERERAAQLKAERKYFEAKPFREIRHEYSWNPIWLIPRLIRWVLAMVFGIIPENTDNPDFKRRRAELAERKRLLMAEREEHDRMEVFYRKYAQTYHYRFLRFLDDQKFKRKRRKDAKGKPKPVYKPPVRTPEQEQEIIREMKQLYRAYYVSPIERSRRWWDEEMRRLREIRNANRSTRS